MRSIVIFRFFSYLPLLFVYQCITFFTLDFSFFFLYQSYAEQFVKMGAYGFLQYRFGLLFVW